MKTIFALLGLTAAARLTTNQDKLFELVQLDASDDNLKYNTAVYDVTSKEYQATKWNKENPHPGFDAGHHEFEGVEGKGAYNRQLPEHFGGPGSGDDQFMYSMIKNYAIEEASVDGKPTGKFIFKYNNAKQAAWEILETHMALKGKAAEDYMKKNFDSTWRHFDTANDGKIEADRMSGFFRFLCGNMNLDLQ